MRFNNDVKFYLNNRHYDPIVGNYVGNEKLVGEEIANVTDVGTNRSKELFGDADIRSRVIRLAHPLEKSWSYCLIDSDRTHYVQTTVRNPLKDYTLIVGEEK